MTMTSKAKKATKPDLSCDCGAKAKNTSKERGRFLRRHPQLDSEVCVGRRRRFRAREKEKEKEADGGTAPQAQA